jgi:hypothetical protein
MLDDVDLKQAGSFEFSMETSKNCMTLRFGKAHSADVLQELLKLLKDPLVRAELNRRLSITRI